MKQERKKYTAKFKADVALAAIKGQLTTAQIAEQYKVSPNMIYKWKEAFIQNAEAVFQVENKDDAKDRKIDHLHRKIGELEMELDFAKRASRALGIPMPEND